MSSPEPLRATPEHTEQQLKQWRTGSQQYLNRLSGDSDDTPVVFTCDDCPARKECIFVYDPYNTSGDCLAEK